MDLMIYLTGTAGRLKSPLSTQLENESNNDRGPSTKHSTRHKSEDLDGRVILSRNHQKQDAQLSEDLNAHKVAPLNVRNSFRVKKSSFELESSNHADNEGFEGHSVQGKVYGPSANQNHHSSEWLSMRPLVLCEDELMTLTASGRGYMHLMVDRVDASPISLFRVPPNCGYHLKTTWRDLVMMAPYNGCYIRQENGNYVLSMLWWGSPVKIACPIPPWSAVSVQCSHFGVAVQILRADVARSLRVAEDGGWVPFVSEECAYRVESHPDDLIYFAPFAASCVTIDNGVHLMLLLDGREIVFSCPRPPPISMSPGEPAKLHDYIPESVSSPPSTAHPPTSAWQPISQLPHFQYPGLTPFPGTRPPLSGRYAGRYPISPTEPSYHGPRDYSKSPAQDPTPTPTSPPQSPSPATRQSSPASPTDLPPFPQYHPRHTLYPAPHLPLPERRPGYYPFYPIKPGHLSNYVEQVTPVFSPIPTDPPQKPSPATRPASLPPGSRESSMFLPPHPHRHPGQAQHPDLYQRLPGRYPSRYPIYPLGPGRRPESDPDPHTPGPTLLPASPPQTHSPVNQPSVHPPRPTVYPPHLRPHVHPGPSAHPGLNQPDPEGYPGQYVIHPIGPGHDPYRPRNDPDTPPQGLPPDPASSPQSHYPAALPPGLWDHPLSRFYPHHHPPKPPHPGLYHPLPGKHPEQYPNYPLGPDHHPYRGYPDPPVPDPTPVLVSPQAPTSVTQPSVHPPVSRDPLLSLFYPPHLLPGQYPGLYHPPPGRYTDPLSPGATPVLPSPQTPTLSPQAASVPVPPYHRHVHPGQSAHPGLYQPDPEGYPGQYVIHPIGPGHDPYRPRNDPDTPPQGPLPDPGSSPQSHYPAVLPPGLWDHPLSRFYPHHHPPKPPHPGLYHPLPGKHPEQYPNYPLGPDHHPYRGYPDPPVPDPTPVLVSPQAPTSVTQPSVHPLFYPPHLPPGQYPGLHYPPPGRYPGQYIIYPIGAGHDSYRPGKAPDTPTQGPISDPTSSFQIPSHATRAVKIPAGPQDPPRPTVYPPYHRPPPVTCPPYAQTFCGYYPYSVPGSRFQPQDPISFILTPSPPLSPPPGPPAPKTALPDISPPPGGASLPTTSFVSPSPLPPEVSPFAELHAEPSLRCLVGHMMVLLPSALPDSVQVKDKDKGWVSISSAPEACRYILQMRKGGGVILYSPLPACHSQTTALDPDHFSFPMRIWDTSLGQYSSLKLLCPSSQPTVAPSPSPAPTSLLEQSPSRPPSPTKPQVSCSARHMSVDLPTGPVSGIVIRDIKGKEVNLTDAPVHCGYVASKEKDGAITLNLPFRSCHMAVQGGMHRIDVLYTTRHGHTREAHLSCPVSMAGSSAECDLPREQRLPCGLDPPSQEVCLSLGCCYSDKYSSCYYPMDECTTDRHFVFLVPASITDPPLSPGLLATTGDPACTPERVTPDYALFKIPLEGCGAHKYEVGQSVIYMVEIVKGIQAISLHYGTITRDSPLRLLVECRYTPSSMASVGYMVKSPSLGPSIQAHGVFGVQLRIAKDREYSSYYPQYHRPLQMLLGKHLYLEVRLLNPPDENVVLLVHYCVAYPRSGQAAWVLLYNGCPNPLDPVPEMPYPTLTALNVPKGQTRRFTISTFQFLSSEQALMDDHEEIYFMCSTEVCSPQDGPCSEGCLDQERDGRRPRTEIPDE
ncbi:hypothetical protein DPEC_G00173080 [Dallia pectoralis]|uniref:Uncharacterized protein n=1 Tax=Dallia pectoralis TaxID=75939 RepID=A0ACC2GDN1_DALPE|nr:hypothetical protein DPEC_G00173080 [Dallia pectoralis]